MQNELKIKLENLSDKFNTELDIISLKALCSMPESEEILFAITGTLNRLMEKYPDDEEILGLLPKKEKISLEELIKTLEETYPNNVEVITIKALSSLSEGETKEKAIKQSLERLLEENSNDENIMEYLDIEDIIPKEKNPDMVFVEGGSYTPSFFDEERRVFDLYVNKYIVTGSKALEVLGEEHKTFLFFGAKCLPKVTDKTPFLFYEVYIYDYCNKLSEKYGLQPVYIIENDKLVNILQLDGKKVLPDEANFEKTEGYRLPTELEWEWVLCKGEDNIDDTINTSENVGMRKPNKIGVYDMLGLVPQYVYDTCTNGYLREDKPYLYENNAEKNILRGKDKFTRCYRSGVLVHYAIKEKFNERGFEEYIGRVGIRVVRTANPKRK